MRLGLRRSGSAQAAQDPEPPAATRRAAPSAGDLRRERKALLRTREDRIHDLGGVVLEMYRQDTFREGLLLELCAEVAAIEDRLRELDILLDARRPPAARCACGAPIFWGTRYCAQCGRPVGTTPSG